MLTREDLSTRFGAVLSDGTFMRDLIDIEKREVSMRVLNDVEIHELELKKIFAKAWIIVGHECEIPEAGDFVSRYMGEDGVLVTRAADGEISVLLNVCSHRGMQVSRVDRGHSSSLVCPYHGWAFDAKGNLMGAPFKKEMYGEWDTTDYGLIKAKVEICNGIIFASFDGPEGPSLDEYLGEFKWYIDFNFRDADLLPTGPIQRFRMPANWKTFAEQLAGDGYHAAHLHRGLNELGINRWELVGMGDGPSEYGYHTNVSFENGHALLSWDNRFIFANRTPEEGDEFGINRSFPMQVFPCSTVGGSGRSETGEAQPVFIGGLMPRGPKAFEFWQLPLAPRAMAEDMAKNGRNPMAGFGAAIGALIFADDAQQSPSMQRSAQGHVARSRMTLKYNSTHGTPNKPSNWSGPGDVYDGFPKDDNQWHWWSHWFDVITAD